MKQEVSQIYVLFNAAQTPYILIAAPGFPNKIMLSRYIMLKQGNEIEDKKIDHLNGNTLDNRIENLRVTTHSINMRNRRQKSNKTGFRGVYPGRGTSNGKYEAILKLGTYDTPEAAHEAYKKAYKMIFPAAVSECKW